MAESEWFNFEPIASNRELKKQNKRDYEQQWNEKNPDYRRQYHKEWRQNNPDNVRAGKKRWAQNNRVKMRASKRRCILKKKYGITPEQHTLMLIQQNDCCAICNRHKSEFKKSLCVDHDHATGKVRALLCRNCNLLLGYARDNVTTLQDSISYLLKHRN